MRINLIQKIFKVSRAVGMEELRLQIIVACQKMVAPNDEFRTRIRNHMNTHMSDNRGHTGDNTLQNHWSQIVAAIMSAEQKYLPDTAKDPLMIYVLRLRNVRKWLEDGNPQKLRGEVRFLWDETCMAMTLDKHKRNDFETLTT